MNGVFDLIPCVRRASTLVAASFLLLGLTACPADPGDPSDTESGTDTVQTGATPSTNDPTMEPGTSTVDPTDGLTTTGGGMALSHATDIQPLWDTLCVTGCHDANGSGTNLTMLMLTPDVAYTSLIDKPANQAPALVLVKPGSRDDSYLWHKLNNTQAAVGGSGVKMPLGKPITDEEIEMIGQWIDEGALP